jgi:hypothetical protein
MKKLGAGAGKPLIMVRIHVPEPTKALPYHGGVLVGQTSDIFAAS